MSDFCPIPFGASTSGMCPIPLDTTQVSVAGEQVNCTSVFYSPELEGRKWSLILGEPCLTEIEKQLEENAKEGFWTSAWSRIKSVAYAINKAVSFPSAQAGPPAKEQEDEEHVYGTVIREPYPAEVSAKVKESIPDVAFIAERLGLGMIEMHSSATSVDVSFRKNDNTQIILVTIPHSPEKFALSESATSPEIQQAELTSLKSGQRFLKLQEEGFPFSKMSKELVQEALTIPIPDTSFSQARDVVDAMLKARVQNKQFIPGSAIWKEMEGIIKNVDSDVLRYVLEKTYYQCENNEDKNSLSGTLSGTCFHVLLKMGINERYTLPESSECNAQALDAGLKSCLSGIDFSSYPNPSRLIELFFDGSSSAIHGIFLPHVDCQAFYALLFNSVTHISFEEWPKKERVINQFFEVFPKEVKIPFASVLESATCDTKTHEVGSCFRKALMAPNLRETYPHLYRLSELLPHIKFHMDQIFHCGFNEGEGRDFKDLFNDPVETDQLNFNSGHVLAVDNLDIGIHVTHDYSSGVKTVTVVGFDKTTNHLVWGLPVKHRFVHSEMTSLGLALAFDNDPTLHIIHPKTGEEIFAVPLPAIPDAREFPYDQIHITPSGFCYFMLRKRRVLYGGQISTGEWKQSFEVKEVSLGEFEPLGPYLRFSYNPYFSSEPKEDTQIIVSHDGSMQTFTNCLGIVVKNGKVFTVDVDSTMGSMFTLTMQDLVPDSEVFQVRGTKIEVPLGPFEYFKLVGVGDDDIVIGLAKDKRFYAKIPIFVDVVKREVVTGQHRVDFGTKFFDPKKSELWSWDDEDRTVWKQAKEGSQAVGIVRAGEEGSLMPIDEENGLYF